VIRLDEQRGGIGKSGVVGVPAWVGMAVRRQDRQVGDALIEAARDGAGAGLDRQQTIGMKSHRIDLSDRARVLLGDDHKLIY
jgi:hypothetical protein